MRPVLRAIPTAPLALAASAGLHALGRLLLLWLALASLPASAQTLARAEAWDAAAGHWQPVNLPDKWQDSRHDYHGATWYRLQVDIERPQALLGVFIKRACNNAWIYANGQLIYSGGGPWEGPRVHRNCHAAVLAAWPRDAQKPGRNELLVRVYSEAADTISSEQRKGHLSAVVVDRWQALQPVAAQENLVRITVPRITSALMAFTAITLFLIWWRVRRERVYLNFALAMACGAIGVARVFVHAPGLDNIVVERIVPAMVVLICLGVMGCLVDLYDLRTRLPRLWWALGGTALALLATVPPQWLQVIAIVGFGIGALAMGVTLVQLARQVLRDPLGEHKLFYLTTTVLMGAGIHDLLVQLRVLAYSDRPLIQNALPILLLGFMMRLLSRHAEALTVAENSRAELEQRVQLITREIESSYARSVALEKDRAAQEERERIARDLHDDLGARLLTLVHRSRDEQTSESAREALSDLRLLIGQLHQPETTLAESISDWRAETQQRCDAAGGTLEWTSTGVGARRLGTRQRIMLGRLLREAVTNILKHTPAGRVAVRFEAADGELRLAISDDWASSPVATWQPGIGMRSLEMRARQIGATLAWEDLPDAGGGKAGTRLSCRLPLSGLDGNA